MCLLGFFLAGCSSSGHRAASDTASTRDTTTRASSTAEFGRPSNRAARIAVLRYMRALDKRRPSWVECDQVPSEPKVTSCTVSWAHKNCNGYDVRQGATGSIVVSQSSVVLCVSVSQRWRSGHATAYAHEQRIDLHKVKWANAMLPGSVCGVPYPIRLHNHVAVAVSHRWGKRWRSASWPDWPRVTVDAGWDHVVYGDLDGDRHDEAALVVGCSNGGGTADGFLAYSQVIFTAARKSSRVIAVVTPQQRTSPRVLPTLLQVSIRRNRVITHEFWYGVNDGTCCPSGRSTTTWRYANGTLRPAGTLVLKRPQ